MMAKRILVIDDDIKELDTIHQIFDKMRVNFTLHRVGNGRDALLTLMGSSNAYVEYHPGIRKERPNIILLNTSLPDMTGSEFLEIISKYYSLADIKIFIMGTEVSQTDLSAYENFAIAGHITKPLTQESLNSPEFKRLRVEMGGNPLYVFLPAFVSSEHTFKSVFGFLRNIFVKIKSALLPGTYTVGAKILTGTVLTASLGLGLANLPLLYSKKGENTKNTNVKPAGVNHLSVTEEVQTIKEMYADLIPEENKEVQTVAVLKPQSSAPKVAGLISSIPNPEPEKEMTGTPSRRTANFRIKVSEENDSIPK